MKPVHASVKLRSFSDIPSPRQLPWFGNTFPFIRKNRLEWISGLSAKYGRFLRLKFADRQIVLVQDPEWIRYILQTHYKDFTKEGRALDQSRRVLGNGLFTSAGEFWRKQRKLMQPAFYKQRLEGLAQLMVDCIASMLGSGSGLPARIASLTSGRK